MHVIYKGASKRWQKVEFKGRIYFGAKKDLEMYSVCALCTFFMTFFMTPSTLNAIDKTFGDKHKGIIPSFIYSISISSELPECPEKSGENERYSLLYSLSVFW